VNVEPLKGGVLEDWLDIEDRRPARRRRRRVR